MPADAAEIVRLAWKAAGLHNKLSQSHPSLSRGQVWCRTCGASRKVDATGSLARGWPKCCGYTMTIDSPKEQHTLRARAQLDHEVG